MTNSRRPSPQCQGARGQETGEGETGAGGPAGSTTARVRRFESALRHGDSVVRQDFSNAARDLDFHVKSWTFKYW